MSMSEKPVTFKDRLSKLENELDELISLQEKNRRLCSSSVEPQRRDPRSVQKCECVKVASCSRTLVKSCRTLTHCSQEDLAPLSDITKFLHHINVNLTKGTQAINKIAKVTFQQNQSDTENNQPHHESCFKKDENVNEFPSVWKPPLGKKLDEDAFFKELREEKDKRIRAENQIKALKEEVKKTKSEIQQEAESTILLLRAELKETLEKLELSKDQLEKRNQELIASEHLWPFKYETIYKELQDERNIRENAERSVQQLQEMLHRQYFTIKEHLTLQQSVNMLKDQNQNLACLTKKLQTESERGSVEMMRKNEMIEEHLRKIKQLSCVCEQLRDHLIMMKGKAAAAEEKLGRNLSHCQRLADKLLEAQATCEELQKRRIQDKQEQNKLAEDLKFANTLNNDIQQRIGELSEILKTQNDLIARQSETIDMKEKQLKLACRNIELQSQRLDDFENKRFPNKIDVKMKEMLESNVSKLESDLENEKENVLVKDKIIDDQLKTIMQLKNNLAGKESDINNQKRCISEKERKLAIEQTTNEQLLSKIKVLQRSKEELKLQVDELEYELESRLSSEHAKRLEHIEKQVREKQKEWEIQKSQLSQEKEEALQLLNSTNLKLDQKTAEYQGEIETKQQMIEELNVKLRKKEEQLKEMIKNIATLTSDLEEAKGLVEEIKKNYEEKFQNAREAWQKTMQLLQS